MDQLAPLNTFDKLILTYLYPILFTALVIIVGYAFYKVIIREIKLLKEHEKLGAHVAYTLIRIVRWTVFLIILTAVLVIFQIPVGIMSALLTVLGGTIIGFAAINTIGNAIAGLIVMTSRPFSVGDRIFYNGQFADVIAVELIYTKMITLDNILISVPNQELLKTEIINFGKEKVVRRHVTITPGFEYDSQEIEKILLEAADSFPRILKDPKPYVWITNFQNYAVEYTLYVYVDDIKGLPTIDAELYKIVLETCKKYNVDISTPMLLRQIQD